MANFSTEVQFAQNLASNEKKIRDKALKKLKKYLRLKSSSKGDSALLNNWEIIIPAETARKDPKEDFGSLSESPKHFQQRDSRSYNRDSTHKFAFSEIAVREETIINANSTDKSPQTSTKSLYRKGPGSRCIGSINLALSQAAEMQQIRDGYRH